MVATHRCTDETPCFISPHPDLLARLEAERQQAGEGVSALSLGARLSAPTGTALGLNDGMIFPPEHFEGPQPESVLSTAALERAPLRGSTNCIVVLVDFPDQVMTGNVAQNFQDLFFSTGKIPTGSVTEYYNDVSNGSISLSGAVVGPFRMPQNKTDYAHGNYGRGADFPNSRTLAADALAACQSSINFSTYDNDKNGFVDAFIVVHAGPGAEVTGNTNDIWSVKWVLPNSVPVNGVNVFAFLTIPEDARIGVCAHELGHLLFGWPDLYDIDGSSQGVGNWCLMAGGAWGGNPQGTKPCHPSAWCKVNQGWVTLKTENTNKSITLGDVKTSKEVHRLWKNGDTASQEYFLVENREQSGYDASLPGQGLLVWHVDDSKATNADETHYKVALMQADGLNQLATSSAGRGDAGDPFPGSSKNHTFSAISNPNSHDYTGNDTFVSVTNISWAAPSMTMCVTVQPRPTFKPVYQQGDPGSGIGGYDLRSTADLAIAFDYDSSGKMDHLLLYRPGTGTCWILSNNNGNFTPKYHQGDPGSGIGGYDLRSPADRIIAFDYDSSGKQDHLVLYRPGDGAIFILKNTSGSFSAVYAQGGGGAGIAGYDLRSPADKIFAFDYNSSGKLDHLCLYRPGTGTFWILQNNAGTFTPVYRQGDPGIGIGGYDLRSPADSAFAFDWDSSGKMDHLALYRPGTGTFWVLKRNGADFVPVLNIGDPGSGIGCYDLLSSADTAMAFDFAGVGKMDHVVLYRPGTGTFWVLKRDADGGVNGFSALVNEGDPGSGVGGYDLKSPADKIFAFDFDHSGMRKDLVLYRTNASGTIWIVKRTT